MLYFIAKCDNSKVNLTWATASETNNDYFNLEKSHDGSTFEVIGIVQGAGFSNSLLYYSLTDADPYNDITYYRIKQTDFNGNFTYSGIISSSCSNVASLALLVSQSDYGINVFITPGSNKNIALSVFDISGKMIFYKHINTIDDPLTISPNLFSSGIYLFRLQSETEDIVKKSIIKE